MRITTKSIPCPACDAPAGKACKGTVRNAHHERVAAAQREGHRLDKARQKKQHMTLARERELLARRLVQIAAMSVIDGDSSPQELFTRVLAASVSDAEQKHVLELARKITRSI